MPANNNSPWANKAMEDRLIALYHDTSKPYSNSTMARILNEEFGTTVTRLSVLGRLYRLVHNGVIEARPGTFKVRRDAFARLRAVAPVERTSPTVVPLPVTEILPEPKPEPPAHVTLPLAKGRWVPIYKAKGCLFPSEDKSEQDEHLFCNAACQDGSSYCAEHHRRVWLPTVKKARARDKEFAQRGWAA